MGRGAVGQYAWGVWRESSDCQLFGTCSFRHDGHMKAQLQPRALIEISICPKVNGSYCRTTDIDMLTSVISNPVRSTCVCT